MKTLVGLVSGAAALETKLIESSGEITEEIANLLQITESHLPEKIDAYDFQIKRLSAIEEHYKKTAEFYLNIAKGCKSAQERMKDNLRYSMQLLTTDELKGDAVRFKLVRTAPKLVIESEAALPEEYKVETIVKEVDKVKLRSDLRSKEIPGAWLEESFALKTFANLKD